MIIKKSCYSDYAFPNEYMLEQTKNSLEKKNSIQDFIFDIWDCCFIAPNWKVCILFYFFFFLFIISLWRSLILFLLFFLHRYHRRSRRHSVLLRQYFPLTVHLVNTKRSAGIILIWRKSKKKKKKSWLGVSSQSSKTV